MEETLKQLARIFGTDRLFKPEDVQTILKAIIGVLSIYKKDTLELNSDTRKILNELLTKIVAEQNKYLLVTDKLNKNNKKEINELSKDILEQLKEVKSLCKEVMENRPVNGKDADEEYVISEVLNRIKLPEQKEIFLDTGADIVNKINLLSESEEFQIDAKHIKNLPKGKSGSISGGVTRKIVQQMIDASGAAGITLKVEGVDNVNQGLLNLVAGTGMTITDNGDGSVTFESTGGSGTPGGSTTQVQYNNGGNFGGISGATTDGSTLSIKDANFLITDQTDTTKKASFQISGIATGTTREMTVPDANGTLAFKSGLTANQIAYASDTNTVSSLSTGTYPDLTELSYLKGTSSAVQTQLNAKVPTSYLDTDVTLSANSDSKIATQKAVKTYVDGMVTGLLELKGDTDCSTNPNYPSALKGDAYYVTVAGKIGGASGKTVEVGDVYVAKADNAGGTEASVGTSWFVLNQNLSGVALTSETLAQFASTTSSQLAGVISDETGSGSLVFGTDPTFTTRINAPEVKATSSAGISLKNSSGTEIALLGAGGTNGTSLLGTTNIGSALADYIQIAGNTGSTTQTATGSSSNIHINLVPKGTGRIQANAVNIPTVSSTDTLTNKTLTTPTINGAVITGDFQTDGLPDTDDTWTGKSTNSFNAAGTIAQFDCVYLTSSSTWALTDADAIGTAGNVLIMMAGATGTVSNPLRVIEPGSWVRNDAWNWTVGGVLYLDTATPGGMTQTAPSGTDDAVKIVGHAVSADVIYFNPSVNWIIHT